MIYGAKKSVEFDLTAQKKEVSNSLPGRPLRSPWQQRSHLIAAEVAIPVDSVSVAARTPVWAEGTDVAVRPLDRFQALFEEGADTLAGMVQTVLLAAAVLTDTVDRAAGIAVEAGCSARQHRFPAPAVQR